MNTKKRAIVLLTVLLAVVTALLWRRGQPAVAGAKSGTTAVASGDSSAAEAARSDGTGSRPVASAASSQAPSSDRTREPRSTPGGLFQTLNHNPIEFYGRVLDQFGEPVAGAEVAGGVIYNTGGASGVKKAATTTDAQGYFQFTDLMGQDLGIGLKKEGYEYRPFNSSFNYSYFEADHPRHIPDPKKPVVFTLWKKQGAEALVQYNKSWEFFVNQGPVRINLETGKIGGSEADLIVTVSRTPLRMPFGEGGFAWQTTIEVVGGGLIRVGEQQYYNLAPATGYQPRFEQTMEAQNIRNAQAGKIKWTWTEGIKETVFVSSRNGKNFAFVRLSIRPNADRNEGDNIASIGAGVLLNPNSSRNLEYDEVKAIHPPR